MAFFVIMYLLKRMENDMERAIFAGGCFWCMVQPFEELDVLNLFYLDTLEDMLRIQLIKKFVVKLLDIQKLLKLFLILKKSLMQI